MKTWRESKELDAAHYFTFQGACRAASLGVTSCRRNDMRHMAAGPLTRQQLLNGLHRIWKVNGSEAFKSRMRGAPNRSLACILESLRSGSFTPLVTRTPLSTGCSSRDITEKNNKPHCASFSTAADAFTLNLAATVSKYVECDSTTFR